MGDGRTGSKLPTMPSALSASSAPVTMEGFARTPPCLRCRQGGVGGDGGEGTRQPTVEAVLRRELTLG